MFVQTPAPAATLSRQGGVASVHLASWITLIGFLCLALWAWPDVSAWLQARGAAVRCPLPAVHEQLHIVVVQRGRHLAAECMYVVPRGMARAEQTRP